MASKLEQGLPKEIRPSQGLPKAILRVRFDATLRSTQPLTLPNA